MRRREAYSVSRVGTPLGVSCVLHAMLGATVFLVRPSAPEALPPIYKVNLIAAPSGPRAAGVVRRQPSSSENPATVPPRALTSPRDMPMPERPQERRAPPAPATPTPAPPSAPSRVVDAPTAGGGPTGGRGTDVATVRTEGIEFPFPGYLENIVRQIALRFEPARSSAYRAEVVFLIRRDGSVSSVRFVKRSGNYAFDLEAQGAVEAAGGARAFGPLPDGFHDDVLPVIFSFDPRVLR
ncbi:MAG: TonB C-terminal domain-containing protein [Gemmatimonadaceae bacterium]